MWRKVSSNKQGALINTLLKRWNNSISTAHMIFNNIEYTIAQILFKKASI